MTENHIQLAVRMGSWGGIPIDGYTVNYVLLNKVCFLSVELGTRIATFLKKKNPLQSQGHCSPSHQLILIFPRYIKSQFNDKFPVGLLAQLVRALHLYWRGQDSNPAGGGGYSTNVFLGGGCSVPRSNPLPFYAIFSRKRYPFRIASTDKWYPLTYLA